MGEGWSEGIRDGVKRRGKELRDEGWNLKVHKREKCFVSDFEFFTIL